MRYRRDGKGISNAVKWHLEGISCPLTEMAHQSLAVDLHPQKDEIIRLRAEGKTLPEISRAIKPYVSREALGRFFTRLSIATNLLHNKQRAGNNTHLAVSPLDVAAALPSVDRYRERLDAHYSVVDQQLAKGDLAPKDAAVLVSAGVKAMELDARLEGRFDQPATQISITVNLSPAADTPARRIEPAQVEGVSFVDVDE